MHMTASFKDITRDYQNRHVGYKKGYISITPESPAQVLRDITEGLEAESRSKWEEMKKK